MQSPDQVLQAACPVLAVPKYEALPAMANEGQRFLVAASGLWCEVRTAWAHVIYPIAIAHQKYPPYGNLDALIEFEFGQVPIEMIDRFIAEARRTPDLECAAVMIWNKETRAWRYETCVALYATGASLEYVQPRVQHPEYLVADIHSHGRHHAFFSAEDDRDDLGTKIAIVVGNLDAEEVTLRTRLCMYGMFIDEGEDFGEAPLSADELLALTEAVAESPAGLILPGASLAGELGREG
jgi:PRTRC genetic system protein A